jgi:putative transcriptional regulator
VHDSLRGRLLVAAPSLLDPNFVHAVILMLEHGPDGAIGIVLNRPSEVSVADALPSWADVKGHPPVVFVGGPVQPGGAIGLARIGAVGEDAPPVGVTPLWRGLGTVDLDAGPDGVFPPVERLRLFAGYSGWGPLQLEGELATNSWFVVDRDPADVWTTEPDGLWTSVLRRQPGSVAQFANCPLDPTTN